jgi:hypothetical protein
MSMPHPEPMSSADPPSSASIASASWAELAAELDRWGEAGRVAKLWWRDDDATTATPQLARLLRVAGGTPLALAVVPAFATADLASLLHAVPSVKVLQHGWRHANRALRGKKSEYPSGLSASVLAAEATRGHDRLAALFGPRALPIFVPPWNRIAPELLAVLADSGIAAVSTIASAATSEHPASLPAGLALIDTHVDLTDWKGGRQFIGAAVALGALVAWLRRNRLGAPASAGPIGILTHHMIMDSGTAAFLEDLTELVAGHRAARWIDIAEVLR